MLVSTVTLNPAIDYIVFPERLEKGKINGYKSCFFRPGGKGVNVSLLLTSLGVENTALGIAAGFTGRELVRLMEEAGCKTDFLFLEGAHSRINLKICLPGGEETDLNGSGPVISQEAVDRLGEKLAQLKPGGSLVLAGSVPPSLSQDVYARLLKQAEGKDLLTVVDTTGEALRAVLPLRPFLIKPNLEELGELFQTEIKDMAEAVEYARILQEKGARNIVVSMGEKGALLVSEDGRSLFCGTAKGKAVSTVGAGDSLVAGFLYGWARCNTPEDALRWGVAAGAATAFSNGIATGEMVRQMVSRIEDIH